MSTSFTRRPLSPTNQTSDSFECVSSARLTELSPTVPEASDAAWSVVLAAVSARASVSVASFSLFTRITTASSILDVALNSRVL